MQIYINMKNKITAQQILSHDYPMALARCPNEEDGEFDGSCPCGEIHGEDFEVEFHCWRSSCKYGCEYSGIHVSGTLDSETKRKIAEHIRDNNGWTNHTDWSIIIK